MAALLGHDLYFMCILVLKQTGFLLESIDRLKKVMEPKDQLWWAQVITQQLRNMSFIGIKIVKVLK